MGLNLTFSKLFTCTAVKQPPLAAPLGQVRGSHVTEYSERYNQTFAAM
jgi:hypothetical protein